MKRSLITNKKFPDRSLSKLIIYDNNIINAKQANNSGTNLGEWIEKAITDKVIRVPEDKNTFLAVSPVGNNSTAAIGSDHTAWSDIITARNYINTNNVLNAFVSVKPGTYTINGNTGLGILEKEVSYYFDPGSKVSIDEVIDINVGGGLGLGALTSTSALLAKYSVLGAGEFTATSTSASARVAVHDYVNNSEFTFKAKSLSVTGIDAWGVQTQATKSIVDIDEIHCNAIVYSSWSNSGTSRLIQHSFNAKNIFITNSATRGGHIRIQPSGGYLPGSYSYVNVENIHMDSTGTTSHAFDFQTNSGGTGGNFYFKFGNIRNETAFAAAYPDYEQTSNNIDNAEIKFAGGTATPHIGTTIRGDIGTIYSNQLGLAINGIVLTQDSHLHVKFGKVVSGDEIALGFFHPQLKTGSTILIEGDFETLASDQPCGMLSLLVAEATTEVRFRNCIFKTSAAGKAALQIIDGWPDDRLIFENCHFINDGTAASLTTDAVTPMRIRFINCTANSSAKDVNITETHEPIKLLGREYANDAAAAGGGLIVGEHYFNTTTGQMHTRMT